MPDDAELLHRYAEQGSEEAFRELVRRHLNLVYTAALRRMDGDAHRAEDVTQIVFTDLARRARRLAYPAALSAWLYAATRNAAINLAKSERRRRERENAVLAEAGREPEETGLGSSPVHPVVDWERIRPVLDEAMDGLGERDREAVLLRFFDGRSFQELSAVLKVSEDAARMRVGRALEKLREAFARRGVTSTAVALAAALLDNATREAPSGMATGVSNGALVGAGSQTGLGTISLAAALTSGKLSVAALVVAAVFTAGVYFYKTTVDGREGAVASVVAPVLAVVRPTISSAGPAAQIAPASGPEQPLSAILAENDQVKAYALFARHVLQLRADDFAGELPVLLAIAKPEQRDTFVQMFLRRWGKLDPSAALAALEASKGPATATAGAALVKYVNTVLAGWVAERPGEAWDYALQSGDLDWAVRAGASSGVGQNRAPEESRARMVVDRWTSLHAALIEAGRYSDAAEWLGAKGDVLSAAVVAASTLRGPGSDLPEAQRALGLAALGNRAVVLAEAWARADAVAAANWINREFPDDLPSLARARAFGGYVRGVAAEDPASAGAIVASVTDPTIKSIASTALIATWAARDLAPTSFAWLSSQVGNNADGSLDAAIMAYLSPPEGAERTSGNFAGERELVAGIHDPAVKQAASLTLAQAAPSFAEAVAAVQSFLLEPSGRPGPAANSISITPLGRLVLGWSTRDYASVVTYLESMASLPAAQKAELLAAAEQNRAPKAGQSK